MASLSGLLPSVHSAHPSSPTFLSADPLALIPQFLDPCGNPLPWGPTARDSANHLGYELGVAGVVAEPSDETEYPFSAESFRVGNDEGLRDHEWTRERRDAERERYTMFDRGEDWHESERVRAWGVGAYRTEG